MVRAFNLSAGFVSGGAGYQWGKDATGFYGIRSALSFSSDLDPLSTVLDLSSSSSRMSCAVLSTGEAKCWGQMFDGSFCSREAPCNVNPPSFPVKQIAVGQLHACVITQRESRVLCFQSSNQPSYRVGRDNLENSEIFSPVNTINFGGRNLLALKVAIASNSDFSCAMFMGGQISCWGKNYHYYDQYRWNGPMIVNFYTFSHGYPVTPVRDIAIGGPSHVCGIMYDGSVICGQGPPFSVFPPALDFQCWTGVKNDAVQFDHSDVDGGSNQGGFCILFASGEINCLSRITFGLATEWRQKPYVVTELPLVFSDTIPAIQISSSWSQACAMFANLRVRCKLFRNSIFPLFNN